MQKYIKLYEDFEDLQSNVTGNWNQIRDIIQSMKPFTIINFKDMEGCDNYLNDHPTDYIKQSYYNDNTGDHSKCPSIFIPSKVNLEKQDFKKYRLLNYLVGKDGDQNITIKTDTDKEFMGNEVVSTLSQNEVYPESHYKVGSVFYKFINFLS